MRLFMSVLITLFTVAIPKIAFAETDRYENMAKELLRQLIETDTTHASGSTTEAANIIARRLIGAGFPAEDVKVIESAPNKGNLIARLRSEHATAKPILLLAHLDVVAADPTDWTLPPFQMTEKDGYWYGRGTTDDKDEAAIHTINMIRWKENNFKPNRDIIIALTADEEGGPNNGVQYLIEHHRGLVDAAFALNEGGGGLMRDGQHVANTVQAAEKVYQSFTLEVTNAGGHSSRPRKDNAIYQLARALLAVENQIFPMGLNEVTRASFRQGKVMMTQAQASAVDGLLSRKPNKQAEQLFSAIPAYNAQLRTTCVATQLEAGHAENALPQRAKATINCRMLPGSDPAQIQTTLARAIDDDEVSITPIKLANPGPASPLTEEVMGPIYDVTGSMWPGIAVLPAMSTGATDGLFFRQIGIPVYGTSGLFRDMNDNRAHGRDERISPQSFYEGLEYLDRLVRAYASP